MLTLKPENHMVIPVLPSIGHVVQSTKDEMGVLLSNSLQFWQLALNFAITESVKIHVEFASQKLPISGSSSKKFWVSKSYLVKVRS